MEPGFFVEAMLYYRTEAMLSAVKPQKTRHWRLFSMPACIVMSIAGHLLCLYAVDLLKPFELRSPVQERSTVSIVLAEEAGFDRLDGPDAEPAPDFKALEKPLPPVTSVNSGQVTPPLAGTDAHAAAAAEPLKHGAQPEAPSEVTTTGPTPAPRMHPEQPADVTAAGHSMPAVPVVNRPDSGVRQPGEFMALGREKLTYRITLANIPAGTAIIEASNSGGEIRITLRILSNEFLSAFYPVDDHIDTRLIRGNYLVTRIRQREGSEVRDTGFTLMLRERNAFWVDRLRERYLNTPLPREDITDLLAGLYFLRNQPLEVGKRVMLHLFDGSGYAPAAVEVVRREHINLPGLREAETVLVHPNLSNSGFFSKTGPLSIWFTDDEMRVPVRLETSIPWGRVRAELVSAESGPDTPVRPDIGRQGSGRK